MAPEEIVRHGLARAKSGLGTGSASVLKNIVFWKDAMYLCQKFVLAWVKYGFCMGLRHKRNPNHEHSM